MTKSIVQIVITGTTEMSPEEFIDQYSPIIIKGVNTYIHNINGDCIEIFMEDFDITGIEEIGEEE